MKPVRRIKGTVSRTGQVKGLEKVDLPQDHVELIVMPEGEALLEKPPAMSADDLIKHLGGLWEDRDDIKDDAAFARELRRKLVTRQERG